jgi:hypothetical protein
MQNPPGSRCQNSTLQANDLLSAAPTSPEPDTATKPHVQLAGQEGWPASLCGHRLPRWLWCGENIATRYAPRRPTPRSVGATRSGAQRAAFVVTLLTRRPSPILATQRPGQPPRRTLRRVDDPLLIGPQAAMTEVNSYPSSGCSTFRDALMSGAAQSGARRQRPRQDSREPGDQVELPRLAQT